MKIVHCRYTGWWNEKCRQCKRHVKLQIKVIKTKYILTFSRLAARSWVVVGRTLGAHQRPAASEVIGGVDQPSHSNWRRRAMCLQARLVRLRHRLQGRIQHGPREPNHGRTAERAAPFSTSMSQERNRHFGWKNCLIEAIVTWKKPKKEIVNTLRITLPHCHVRHEIPKNSLSNKNTKIEKSAFEYDYIIFAKERRTVSARTH